MLSSRRTEIDAEPHTRSNSVLEAGLFKASANASGEADALPGTRSRQLT